MFVLKAEIEITQAFQRKILSISLSPCSLSWALKINSKSPCQSCTVLAFIHSGYILEYSGDTDSTKSNPYCFFLYVHIWDKVQFVN